MAISISNKSLRETVASLGLIYAENAVTGHNEILFSNIEKYLAVIGKETTVVENEYVDTHFIDDFCGHYGRCFVPYGRKCVRLHFFSRRFELADLYEILISNQDKNIVENVLGQYLGYIVLRPIPASIFAKVCLAADIVERPGYKIMNKPYRTHLCGLTFVVPTIAFQEQDHAISACATVALWMGLNAAPGILPRDVPSPYEINEIVKMRPVDLQLSNTVDRGLNVSQMVSVINERDFEALAIRPATFGYAKAVIRAYIGIGIPVLLGLDLHHRSAEPEQRTFLGKHAVTVIGFEGEESLHPFEATIGTVKAYNPDGINLYLESSAMKSLIVHDDQIGPFSKMVFPGEYSRSLETEWIDPTAEGNVDAFIDVLTVMNIPKVRIRFSSILEIVMEINRTVYNLYQDECLFISWDIRLVNVCALKREIRSLPESQINNDDKLDILTRSLPRYIWTADLLVRVDDKEYRRSPTRITSYYFDATDMENAGIFLFGINYDSVGWISKVAFDEFAPKTTKLSPSLKQIREAYILSHIDKGANLLFWGQGQ